MIKKIAITCIGLAMLGSCSINQSYVNNNVNSNNQSQRSDRFSYSNNTPTIAQAVSSNLQKAKDCKITKIARINTPSYDIETLENSKTKDEMIEVLLDHIEDLKKEINYANKRISEHNSKINC